MFVGDDWSEDHHDVEVQDETGRRLAKARLPEGVAGIGRLHALIGQFAGEDADPSEVLIGIETDRGPWVAALVAAGYRVFAINPLQVARYRERQSTSGAKSDAGMPTRWRTWSAPMLISCARWPGTASTRKRSKWWRGRIRAWSGSGVGMCCGCGRRCGSSSLPGWRHSLT